MLLVQAPPDRSEERSYILDLVLGEWLGLGFRPEPGDGDRVIIRDADDPAGPALSMPDVLLRTPPGDWLTERSLPSGPLPRVRLEPAPGDSLESAAALRSTSDLPVLFGRVADDGQTWRRGEDLELSIDVFGTVFFLVTRYEEVVRRVQDRHGRFPASASILAGTEDASRPLADEVVELLRSGIRSLWPGMEMRTARYALQPTHDIDEPWAAHGRSAGTILHAVAGDVVRRRDPGLAARRIRAAIDLRRGRFDRDPYDTFDLLMSESEARGLASTFYVLAGNEPSEPDFRYRVDDPRILGLLRRIHERGHHVGLHASYRSHGDPDRVAYEFDALRAACLAAGFEQPSYGVRQHYLRFETPSSWRAHVAAGFEHDSTIGWADAVGYRAGTGRDFPVFDVEEGRRLPIRERPLLVMDVSLLGYLALPLEAATRRAVEVLEAARGHATPAVILYHNNTLGGDRVKDHYRAVMAAAGNVAPGETGAPGHRFDAGPGAIRGDGG